MIDLRCIEAGPRDARPLLLVHGFGGAKEDFADHLGALGALGWHVVAPDLRGHGESEWPKGEDAYSFETFAGDLVDLARSRGWASFALLGHSMGGMIAQELVLSPDGAMVDALVLMDTAHGPMDWLDRDMLLMGVEVLRKDGVDAYVDLTDMLRDADPLVTPAFRRLLEERPGYAEFCDRKARATAADMRAAMMPVFVDQRERLPLLASSVRVPTLCLAGEQDDGFVDHCRAMAGAFPGATLAVIDDAGHSPQFENPAQWFDALAGFLADIG
jgi:pimeloyl-ACP methyl ester carboxylesterase